jgi:hypothetical protein
MGQLPDWIINIQLLVVFRFHPFASFLLGAGHFSDQPFFEKEKPNRETRSAFSDYSTERR